MKKIQFVEILFIYFSLHENCTETQNLFSENVGSGDLWNLLLQIFFSLIKRYIFSVFRNQIKLHLIFPFISTTYKTIPT